ncbi:NAD(P)-dependent oxidoreductase [Kitasatospora sp. NA04385]|uniref:NAD(P)-dependent oxidoreductase n=1 Tax=Kitasatospora sp. NA04385 TaxID=2742135 RepID=UPI0015916E52|nr:NAD(P)-dependent oxidoreductase [Kitasatospora sp. NA04385]QKW20082.1 NAD(P)-dependent oxidoreductase [Kitasatospora sp. NA04385]
MEITERVAVLGLGRMGLPMARRLDGVAKELTVWNRTAGRAGGLAEAASPEEAVRGADVVVTVLADPAAVVEVADRFRPALAPGALWIDISSIGPAAVAEQRAQLPDGVQLVDAPVLGSVTAAAAGSLVVYAGGEDSALDRAQPVLEHLGRVVRCGGPGAGAALKLVMMGAVVSSVTVVGEALAVAERLGVPAAQARRALAAGPLSGVMARIDSTDADFPIRLAAKDLALAGGGPVFAAALATLLADPARAELDLGAAANG